MLTQLSHNMPDLMISEHVSDSWCMWTEGIDLIWNLVTQCTSFAQRVQHFSLPWPQQAERADWNVIIQKFRPWTELSGGIAPLTSLTSIPSDRRSKCLVPSCALQRSKSAWCRLLDESLFRYIYHLHPSFADLALAPFDRGLRYVERPLLVANRKCDLRLWVPWQTTSRLNLRNE